MFIHTGTCKQILRFCICIGYSMNVINKIKLSNENEIVL